MLQNALVSDEEIDVNTYDVFGDISYYGVTPAPNEVLIRGSYKALLMQVVPPVDNKNRQFTIDMKEP